MTSLVSMIVVDHRTAVAVLFDPATLDAIVVVAACCCLRMPVFALTYRFDSPFLHLPSFL